MDFVGNTPQHDGKLRYTELTITFGNGHIYDLISSEVGSPPGKEPYFQSIIQTVRFAHPLVPPWYRGVFHYADYAFLIVIGILAVFVPISLWRNRRFYF